MSNRKKWSAVGLGCFAVLCLAGLRYESRGGEAPKEPRESRVGEFMRSKLTSSQNILEGIVTEDFKMIKEASKQLVQLSQAADWQVVQGPVYNQDSVEFRQAAERLGKTADEKNADGAALAYLQVTLSCINCHKHVRGAKVAGRLTPESEASRLAFADHGEN